MSARFELPIFPLNTVLFPGGVLPLKIFEQRYMAMAKDCLREDSPFGVCLIAQGTEVGVPALPHAVGTSARIAEWDMPQLGVLQVASRGGRRFRILSQQADSQGLIRAQVQWLAEEPEQPVPAERAGLIRSTARLFAGGRSG
jgi:Lon protease-like protein